MLVAYVAGPYRSETIYGIEQNIQRAKRLAAELWKRGYAVICPHANSAFMDGVCDDETFLREGWNFYEEVISSSSSMDGRTAREPAKNSN